MTTTGTPVSNEANRSTWRTARGSLSAFLVGTLLGVGLLAAALSALGPSPLTTTCTFTTVGTTMTLDGDCTTDATITIPDGYTLDGNGHTITAVDPPSGHFVGGVVENAGSTAHVTNLGISASNLANVCDGGANRLRGILFDGASGSITDNVVEDINQGTSGCQEGNGIEVRNAPFDGTHPDTKDVTIQGNVVTNYQKNGITANGDVYATVRDNVVVGAGMVMYIAQNGIQIGFGATGQVRGNVVRDNWYTPVDWVASGILVFEASGVMVQSNVVEDTQVGVAIETWCSGAPAASNNIVLKNLISGSQLGVSIAAFTFDSLCDPHADNNKVILNLITDGVGTDSVGVSIGAFDLDGAGGFTPSADNNKVVNTTIDGYATAVSDEGTRTKIPQG